MAYSEIKKFCEEKQVTLVAISKTKTPEEILTGETCSFLHPEIYKEVAWLCTNLTYMFDPDIIVIGGSAGKALKDHTQNILDELKNWILPATPMPEIAISSLAGAGMLGAAMVAKK